MNIIKKTSNTHRIERQNTAAKLVGKWLTRFNNDITLAHIFSL